MLNRILNLSKNLIEMKTIPEDRDVLNQCLTYAVSGLQDYSIEYFEKDGVKSVLVYNTPKRPKKFKIILNGHLDIIPGKDFQYVPKVIGNKLYGVGSMDMKASNACFVEVFKEIANQVNYPLALQLVTDEEVGGFNGTKYQIDQGVRADFVIVGESTGLTIENEAKGIIWAKVSCTGKSAHGAYPWKGDNALWKMQDFLSGLAKAFPIPEKKEWVTTVNLAKIETNNQTFNKIPDNCVCWLDIRYIPSQTDKIVPLLKKILPKGFNLEIVVQEPAQFVSSNDDNLRLLQKIGKQVIGKDIILAQGQGSSDARHYTRVKCAAIEFGPVGGGMGSDNEWVDINSLQKYSEILRSFLLTGGEIK